MTTPPSEDGTAFAARSLTTRKVRTGGRRNFASIAFAPRSNPSSTSTFWFERNLSRPPRDFEQYSVRSINAISISSSRVEFDSRMEASLEATNRCTLTSRRSDWCGALRFDRGVCLALIPSMIGCLSGIECVMICFWSSATRSSGPMGRPVEPQVTMSVELFVEADVLSCFEKDGLLSSWSRPKE